MAEKQSETAGSRFAGNAFIALAITAAIIGVGALFLGPYLAGRVPFPVGTDTKKYIWRAKLAAADGLGAIPGSAPAEFEDNPDRPGYPAIASTVWGLLGIDPVRFAEILPAVMAIAAGLAAGVFATRCLNHPPWAFAIFLLVVGASMQITRTAVGYADNLIVDVVLLAAAVAATMTPKALRKSPKPFTRRSLGAALFLLLGAVAIHWIFTVVFLAMLGLIMLLRLPSSIRAHRGAKIPLLATESGRTGLLVALATLGGFLTLLIGPALPSVLPSSDPARLVEKFNAFLPRYGLDVTLVLAAIGAVLILLAANRFRWRAVWMALVWAAVGVVAVWAFNLGIRFAAYRFLGFALGIPLLGAVAIVWPGRLGRRFGLPGAIVAGVLMSIGLYTSVAAANSAWNGDDPVWVDNEPVAEKIAQVETVDRYLDAIGWTGPIVFVDNTRTATALHLIRAVMPAERIPKTFTYLGDTETLLQHQPTIIPGQDDFNSKSLKTWESVQMALDQDAIVVDLSTQAGTTPTTGFLLTPTITIVQGPAPPSKIAPAQPHFTPTTPAALTWRTFATLALLAIAGLGWSVSLMQIPIWERIAISPAFGIVTLALGGVIGSRFGAPFLGPPIRIVTFLAAALGWAPLILREIQKRESAAA